MIDEIPYRLGRAYTLDTDNNGAVDDVSFEMIRQDGSKLGMSYAALRRGAGGAPIVGLTLPDPASLGRLCPGSYTFPDPGPYVAQASPLQRPNLAAEVAARIRATPDTPPPVAPDGAHLWRWVTIVVAVVGMVLALVVLIVLHFVVSGDRRRKERRKADRRRRDDGPKGEERRSGSDRRSGEDRRTDEPRRQQGDLGGAAAPGDD